MAKACEMKLLGTPGSPFVIRIQFALKLKSIDYEFITEDLTNKSELLRTSNPAFHRVPVLFHANEQPISESLVIIEYLEEIMPDVYPILPSNSSYRAQARYLAAFIDTMYFQWMREFMVTQESERKEELKRLIIQGSATLEEAFVMLSKGKAFFGGDELGYLDIVVGCLLGWFKFIGLTFGFNMIDEARNPKLVQWAKSMWSHDTTRSVIPSQDVHMKFSKMVLVLFGVYLE